MAQGSTNVPPPVQAPDVRTLTRASVIAVIVAAILLVTVVLPAEYGIDPLRTGAALGVAALSAPLSEPVPPPEGDTVAPVQEGPFALYPAEFKVDSREFVLGPYEYVEYKYHLEQGATMLFAWRASDDVMHDFHGVPDGAPASAEQSFDARPRREADGSFAAPFTGIHGWYWENPGGETVTVRVTTSGFYTAAHEFSYDRTRLSREVRSLETIAPAGAGKEYR